MIKIGIAVKTQMFGQEMSECSQNGIVPTSELKHGSENLFKAAIFVAGDTQRSGDVIELANISR